MCLQGVKNILLMVHFENYIWNSGAVQRLSQNCLLDAYTIVQTDEASIAKLIYPVHILSW